VLNKAESSSSQPTAKKSKAGGLKRLIREVLSDSDDDPTPNAATTMAVGDPSRPWRAEFSSYLKTIEAAPPAGMSTIRWWGVSTGHPILQSLHSRVLKINAERYPVWASLARDYLSIMAASVSSERAFSQGRITISKWRNRLKGDIVEALQCIKSALRHELLFPEPGPSSLIEDVEPNESETEPEAGAGETLGDVTEDESWDAVILEDDEESD
jgi:hypothetical protein